MKNLLDKLKISYRFYLMWALVIVFFVLFVFLYLAQVTLDENKLLIVVLMIIVSAIIFLDTYIYNRKLEYALYHDAGTNLPNRKALWKAIDSQFKEKDLKNSPNGLAVISIDNLHDISITFNHDVADELIVTLWE